MRGRKSKNLWILYGGLVIVLTILFFRFGIQLFIDTAFFVATGGKDRGVSKYVDSSKRVAIMADPLLDAVPHATNTAELVIKGKASPDVDVLVFHNSEQVTTSKADYEGNFEFTLQFDQLDNEVFVETKDDTGKKSYKSAVYSISYIKDPPKLELTNVRDGQRVYSSDISIEGKVAKEIFVTVNDLPVVVKADNSFSFPYTLSEGDNQIVVVAQDIAGNSTKQELKITYVK